MWAFYSYTNAFTCVVIQVSGVWGPLQGTKTPWRAGGHWGHESRGHQPVHEHNSMHIILSIDNISCFNTNHINKIQYHSKVNATNK